MMTNEEFIKLYRQDDVHQLALKTAPDGVNLKFCLQQIEGWQLACKKLPRWAAMHSILYPPRISMEQCSSQQTAEYKLHLAERLLPDISKREVFADLTGGFGVDFSMMAQLFRRAVYVERDENLCALARHNMPLLFSSAGSNTEIMVCHSAQIPSGSYNLIFLDPSRRDGQGHKVVVLEDCSPDVSVLQEELLEHAPIVMLKLSPMLDISLALQRLGHVKEIHVVGVNGECKELLMVLSASDEEPQTMVHCVNLGVDEEPFVCNLSARRQRPQILSSDCCIVGGWLHEPNACILKAGVQEALAQRMGVLKLHPFSNLYFSKVPFEGTNSFMRSFHITGVSDFKKSEIRRLLGGLRQANLTVRNFPSSVSELRKKLQLAEGGNVYLFATTDSTERHILIRTERE